MYPIYKRYRDPQRVPAAACCSLCGMQLSPGDDVWYINGLTLCESCLAVFARQDYASHHRVCGEEGER